MKILALLCAILGLYTIATTFVIVDQLKSTPEQIFNSTEVDIIKKGFDFETLKNDLSKPDDPSYVLIIPKSGESTLYIQGYDRESSQHSSLKDLLLQYASGSNDAYAENCPTKKHTYKCTGPYFFGDDAVIPRTCSCVRI